MVWAVLDCPTTIMLAKKVALQLGKPLAVLVWDAPELFCEQLGLDRWSRRRLLDVFGQTMRFASRSAVVGESMQVAYDAAFGSKSLIVRHGLAERPLETRSSAVSQRAEWVIGFAGSLTASDAFNRLVTALDSVAWRIDDREVVLRIVGTRYVLEPRGPRRIEYFGLALGGGNARFDGRGRSVVLAAAVQRDISTIGRSFRFQPSSAPICRPADQSCCTLQAMLRWCRSFGAFPSAPGAIRSNQRRYSTRFEACSPTSH